MGIGRLVVGAALLAAAAILAPGASAEPGPAVSSLLDGPAFPALTPQRWTIGSLLSCAQDTITEDEYNRLTGVRKRIGIGVWGMMGVLGGPDAGSLRLKYSDTSTSGVSYTDLFDPAGIGFGGEACLIVAPFYSVHFGGGYLYHQGKPYRGNDWSDLARIPFFIGLRFNAPLALEFDRWLDFENPEFVNGLIPYAKLILQATWWNRVEVSGAALPSYEPTRDYFVQGIYPEVGAAAGIELRLGKPVDGLALFAECGLTYQVLTPHLSLYFSKDPSAGTHDIVPGSPYEFFFRGGLAYYFGSGRIFNIDSAEG
jgi:hypothetical protein